MFMSRSIVLMVTVLTISSAIPSQALSPPLLRAVCGAVADAEEVMGAKALAAGKAAVDMAVKPIAIVGGLKAAAVGTGMKIGGGAIKFVGGKMVKDGLMMEAAGAGVKGAGLGVAALGLKPVAEKIVVAGKVAEGSLEKVHAAADNFAKGVGDTSIRIGATIDSPIIGHHKKEMSMSTGLEQATNSVEQQVVQQQQQQTEAVVKAPEQQAHAISKRAAKLDIEVLRSALNLVKEAKLEDCVSRAICDLNCNPQGFGQDGKQVFLNMVRLQGANQLDHNEVKLFQEAAALGRANSGKSCDLCSTTYKKCNSKSSDLIKMASHIRMD